MKFLTDENLPRSTVQMLRELGHEVKDVREAKLSGFSDRKLFEIAKNESRILVTLDKDFGNILYFPPKEHSGIIVLRLRQPTQKHITSILRNFIQQMDEDELKQSLRIVEDSDYRTRR